MQERTEAQLIGSRHGHAADGIYYLLRDADMHGGTNVRLAFDRHEASEQRDKTGCDREAQTESAALTRSAGICLVEAVIDFLELVIGHALAGIRYLDAEVDAVIVRLGRDPNIDTAFGSVLKAVRNESPQDLLDLGDVRIHDCGDGRVNVDDELDILGFVVLQVGDEIVEHR